MNIKKTPKVDRAIFYDKDVDTYYVHHNLMDEYFTTSFPTLEDAQKFRDEVYAEKLRLKLIKLHEVAYKKEQQLLKRDLVYPYNVLATTNVELDKVDISLIDNFTELLRQVLTDREQTFILKRYVSFNTLDEIAKEYNLTKERIRQIISKALCKIKHYLLRKDNEILIEYKKKQIDEAIAKDVVSLNEHRAALVKEFKEKGIYTPEMEITFGKAREANICDYNEVALADLDLSVRSYNCLRRYGFKTVNDLLKLKYPEDYMKIRNLGRKSMREIADKLFEKGIDITQNQEK